MRYSKKTSEKKRTKARIERRVEQAMKTPDPVISRLVGETDRQRVDRTLTRWTGRP